MSQPAIVEESKKGKKIKGRDFKLRASSHGIVFILFPILEKESEIAQKPFFLHD